MSLFSAFYSKSENIDCINYYIERAKHGDTRIRNKLIKNYQPFILKVVSNASQKSIDIKNSDEYSIGLLAFNEAIDNFDINKGLNFFSYCKMLIHCRIIDYYRKNQKENSVYPFTYFQSDDDISFEEKYLSSNIQSEYENIESKEEIVLFKQRLKEFDISLDTLVKCTPKHKDSIKLCVNIAKTLSDDSVLFAKLMKSKTIPLKELLKLVKVHQRTIERNRKFIIAMCLIIKSDLLVIKSYIENIVGRDSLNDL